jgi:hypothetical protein
MNIYFKMSTSYERETGEEEEGETQHCTADPDTTED